MRRRLLAVLVAAGIATTGVAIADSDPDGTLDTSQGACDALQTDAVQGNGVWREQEQNAPGATGARQNDRISLRACPPGGGPGTAVRFELRPYDDPAIEGVADGDVNPVGNTSRAEVYDEYPASNASSTPWSQWPLASNGGEHWIHFQVYLDPSWQLDTTKWLDILQLKGYNGGSPPLALGISYNRFKLVGKKNTTFDYSYRGAWQDFLIHVKLDPVVGGIEAWQNGVLVQPWWSGPTMDTYGGQPDPVYLKWGIYRTSSWAVTHIAWFGPMTVTNSQPSSHAAAQPER